MTCAGCRRELEIGDQFIEAKAGEFMGQEVDAEMSDLLADLLGSGVAGKVVYCEDCTQAGGDFMFSTYYGDAS